MPRDVLGNAIVDPESDYRSDLVRNLEETGKDASDRGARESSAM